ncbi:MAG: hypothetical protein KME23_07990 [Goleter apudmare HA4340-LM2]|jgi:hypothetical protein|nr:hypothetical protein [Goleter apudmare HA4340-LM2]
MVVTSRVISALNPTINTLALNNGIKAAFSSIGLNPFDEYLSGTTRFLVYEHIYESSKTFGRLYNRVGITSSLGTSQELFTSWNTSTKAGANSSGLLNYTTYSATTAINISAFDGGSEYKLLEIVQGNAICTLGTLLPQFKADWWDTNQYPYGFIFQGTTTITALRGGIPNPFSNVNYTGFPLNNALLNLDNTITNQSDVIKGICVYTNTNRGIVSRTSDDIGACNGNSKTRFSEILLSDNTRYMILKLSNGGLCLRTQ